MKAVPIQRSKVVEPNGSIQEIVIWQLPAKTQEQPHGFKYRLYFGLADGTCLVRYDNEKGKGDHKHLRDKEVPYTFSTLEQLMEDFLADVERAKEGKL